MLFDIIQFKGIFDDFNKNNLERISVFLFVYSIIHIFYLYYLYS